MVLIKKEGIQFFRKDAIDAEINFTNRLISIFDKLPTTLVLKSPEANRTEIDNRGLFWLLDDEYLFANADNEKLCEKIFHHFVGKG